MPRRPENPWQVLADSLAWARPQVVGYFATEAEAREECRRLNALGGSGRPLYFVQAWETNFVLDTENCETEVTL